MDHQAGTGTDRPPETLQRGEVTLRAWQPSDAGPLAALVRASLSHLWPWMPWAAEGYGVADAAEFISSSIAGRAAGTAFNYAIETGGELAGSCGLMARIGPGGLEIGYWVAASRTRQGLATAAAAALTDAALALPGVDHVEIHHDAGNVASGGVARKLGFTEAGRRPATEDPPPPAGTGVDVIWRQHRGTAGQGPPGRG